MFYSELKLELGNSYRLREQIYLSIINNYFLEMNHYLFHKSNNVLRKQRIIEFKKRSSSEFYRSAFKNIKLLSIGRFFGMEKVIVAECIRLKAYGILYLLFEFKYKLKVERSKGMTVSIIKDKLFYLAATLLIIRTIIGDSFLFEDINTYIGKYLSIGVILILSIIIVFQKYNIKVFFTMIISNQVSRLPWYHVERPVNFQRQA